MILPDTSIWIEFFKSHDPYFTKLKDYLERREVIAISPIFGELLQEVRNINEKRVILEYWNYLPKTDETNLLIKAGEYSLENRFIAKGVGIIDASIVVTAMENRAVVWTLDKKLNKVLGKKHPPL